MLFMNFYITSKVLLVTTDCKLHVARVLIDHKRDMASRESDYDKLKGGEEEANHMSSLSLSFHNLYL